ncbi:MAG: hypothetical protein ACRCYQ_11685 [Nocardioides sp.]
MSRGIRMVVGAVLFALGALWTGQGLGYIGGSFMTDSPTWVVIGSITAVAGAMLARSGRGERAK